LTLGDLATQPFGANGDQETGIDLSPAELYTIAGAWDEGLHLFS